MKRKEFKIDHQKYLWKDTVETYEDNYPFGDTEEQSQMIAFSNEREFLINYQVKLAETQVRINFSELMSKYQSKEKARSLAVSLASSYLKASVGLPGRNIDNETESDASIVDTERWWQVLETFEKGDWSLMIGELLKEARNRIFYARVIFGSKTSNTELGKILANKMIDVAPDVFKMADESYEFGMSIRRLVLKLLDFANEDQQK